MREPSRVPRRTMFAGLTLRARTVLVGGTLSVVLVGVAAVVPLPYVALGPGVTYDTLGTVNGTPVISFTGTGVPDSTKASSGGHLNMTTVSVYDHQTLFEALGRWADGDFSIVPRAEIYPPDKSRQQVEQENAQMFSDSQSAAEIAALRYLKYPDVVYVGTIPDDSPSAKVLEPQDQILAIDGTAVTDLASLQNVLAPTKPGQTVQVQVMRGSSTVSAEVTLEADSASARGYLGVSAVSRPKASFAVDISLANIGGPSAGLMFTLGVIDKLTADDLTGGRYVAGTGTMEVDDDKGTVGAIGGILLKEIAARDVGATVFLVPADNCSEAVTQVPKGLELVKVTTLTDAVGALKTLSAGGTPPGC